MHIEQPESAVAIEKNDTGWYITTGSMLKRQLMLSAVVRVETYQSHFRASFHAANRADSKIWRLRLHPGVHHALVGTVAAALADDRLDDLVDALKQSIEPTPRAVCLYVEDAEHRILAVSRKHDRTKFGLPGGKVDPGETDLEAIVREVREETGLEVVEATPYFEKICWGSRIYTSLTFLGVVNGEIGTKEPIDVKWVDMKVLLEGPFADYNRQLFRRLGRLP